MEAMKGSIRIAFALLFVLAAAAALVFTVYGPGAHLLFIVAALGLAYLLGRYVDW